MCRLFCIVPLSHYNLALLLDLEVHPALADPDEQKVKTESYITRSFNKNIRRLLLQKDFRYFENSPAGLAFLEILAVQEAPVRGKKVI